MPSATPPRLTSPPKSCKNDCREGGCTSAGGLRNFQARFLWRPSFNGARTIRSAPKVKEQRKNNTTSFPIYIFLLRFTVTSKKAVRRRRKETERWKHISGAFLFESLFSLASNCLPNIANRCASIKEPDLHSIVAGLTRATLAEWKKAS